MTSSSITTIYYFSGLPSFFITTTTTTTVTFSSLKTTISEAEPIVATAYEVVSVSTSIVSFLRQSAPVLLAVLQVYLVHRLAQKFRELIHFAPFPWLRYGTSLQHSTDWKSIS